MTERCQGADSRVKPGAPLIAQIGQSAFMAAATEWFPQAIPIVLLLEAFSLSTQSLCPYDPPPMPVFDLDDMVVFMTGSITPHWSVTAGKMGDLLRNWAWPLYCDCVDGSPPVPVAKPLPPSGSSYGGYAPNRACAMGGWAGNVPFGNGDPPPAGNGIDVGYRLLPSDGTKRQFTAGNSVYTAYKKLTGVTNAEWTRKSAMSDSTIPSIGPNVIIQEWTDSNVWQRTHMLDLVHDNPQNSGVFSIASQTTWMTAYAGAQPILSSGGNIVDPLVTVNIEWFCGTTSDTLSSCCPPDPSISLALSNLITIVTDIQNKLAEGDPTWADGFRHTNISGTGSFLLHDAALGIRVETHPPLPPVIIIPGTPSYYYDMGFVTPYILQSPLRSTRITFSTQTIQLPKHTEQIGYTLLNGVQVDIIELVAAPTAASKRPSG